MRQTFVILNEMVSEGAIKDYALCEAMAAFRYIEPAATRDMDVTVEMAGISASLLTFDRIKEFLVRKNMPLNWDEEGIEICGIPVQLIPVSTDLDREGLETASIVSEDEISFKVWKIEYLMAKCLQVGRAKDNLRLVQFLETSFDQDLFCSLVDKFGLRNEWASFCKKFDVEDFCGRS